MAASNPRYCRTWPEYIPYLLDTFFYSAYHPTIGAGRLPLLSRHYSLPGFAINATVNPALPLRLCANARHTCSPSTSWRHTQPAIATLLVPIRLGRHMGRDYVLAFPLTYLLIGTLIGRCARFGCRHGPFQSVVGPPHPSGLRALVAGGRHNYLVLFQSDLTQSKENDGRRVSRTLLS